MDPSPDNRHPRRSGKACGEQGEDAGCLVQKEVVAEVYKTVNSFSNGKLQPPYLLFLIAQEQ